MENDKEGNMESKTKILDLINYKEKEVRISLLITVILILLLYHIQIYNDFSVFEEKICTIIEIIIGGIIGLIGFSISGIAIIVALFSKEEVFLIEKINDKNVLEKILQSYKFLSESLAIEVIYLIVIDVCISSDKVLVNKYIFWILATAIVYHFCFNIFYLIELINNCIKLYKIKQIYGELHQSTTERQEEKDEVRIDFILSTLMNICKCSQDDLCKELIRFVEKSQLERKDELINYFTKKYGNEKKND